MQCGGGVRSEAGAGGGEGPLAHLRTSGGEPTIVRTASGRLQLRLAPPGRMNAAAERRFLHALAATANVRLSAAAAGFAHSSFYARARKARPFAREMRGALAMAYDRLEWTLLQSALPHGDGVAAWRHDEPAPVPPMSVGQMLQLLFLHEKSVRQSWEKPHRRKRRGEPWETYTERLRAMWVAEKAREAEDEQTRRHARRRAERYETSGDWRLPEEIRPGTGRGPAAGGGGAELPPLELVTGWSKAAPEQRSGRRASLSSDGDGACRPTGSSEAARKRNPDKALFGGWRITDWKKL
jgi:hypothetical protein